MNVLIACECSQTVCLAFRALGDCAFSCDICDEYGGAPQFHIKSDVRSVLNTPCKFTTMDGKTHFVERWNLIIAHPPCTYLSLAQNRYYNRSKFGNEYVDRRIMKRDEAVQFFLLFTKTGVPTLIENPPGYMNRHYRKADQTIQPFEFGDAAKKATCLWLFGLPKLIKTKIVDIPDSHMFPNSNSMSAWYYETSCLPASERAKVRSKTFPGIANAIARQYHNYLRWFKITENNGGIQ